MLAVLLIYFVVIYYVPCGDLVWSVENQVLELRRRLGNLTLN